ncbi:AraC family transcriptional regulator [Limnoraphis robusta]|uniref:AraC family transcriptional regulator n=1 Tax=Limnoraphis robusta TaxID=1118279 RepID=UPI002B214589|nr:AraC family transcriptional regulator [Limnoraphis robusta]MEA5500502.1 AraC family transcriptional regulator [Limnoraphis robusta BA-68 BA1]
MAIITNPKSVAYETPAQMIQLYRCDNNSSEDPGQTILTRHMIGLTIKHPYRLALRHNSDRTQDLRLSPGEFFIFPTGASHWAAWKNCHGLIASIDHQLFNHYAERFLEGKRFELNSVLKQQDPLLEQLLLTLAKVSENADISSSLYKESLCMTFVLRLIECHSHEKHSIPRVKSGLSRHSLQQVIDYIEIYYSEAITITTLAQQVGLSEYHFLRCFKQSMGLTPYQYIIKKRLEMAEKLLIKTQQSLAEIAVNCGFSSQSHMTNLFKQRLGKTPLQIRQTVS